ncbi:MAG: hypothetical protein R3358_02025 [Woeseiaceae bacterium]|nr:hypothetical protein [Woeseiaceae bacterium]
MNGTFKGNGRDDLDDVDIIDDDIDDDDDAIDPEHTIVMDADDDDDVDVSDITGELNIEELVAKLDKTDADDAQRRRFIKARLDELAERKMTEEEFASTYTFDFDDDD